MNQALLLRSILARLARYKLKTFFMGLGITISVFAMVLLQTVGDSTREAFTSFIESSYPSNSIFVMAGSGFMGWSPGGNNLRLSEVETIASSIGTTEWDPVVNAGFRSVKHAGNSVRVWVGGYSERSESVRSRSVQEGEFFSAADVRGRSNVALIGSTTAETLFPGESPVGIRLFIDNVPFEVKGLLETVGVDPHGNDQDNVIYVPYTTLMSRMLKVNFVGGAMFLVDDRNRAEAVAGEIAAILREQHQIGEGQEDDFSVVTPSLMYELVDRAFRTFDVFVPIIAGTAFLISTAVILGIMLISIKGRTAEIGLRKAVGARFRDLQAQIVLEVLIVSTFASLIGLLLAYLGSRALTPVLAARFGVEQMSPTVTLLIGAVCSAIATGLLSSLLPARRAAKLDPVEALR